MDTRRLHLRTSAALLLVSLLFFSPLARAQSRVEEGLRPDVQRAATLRTHESASQTREGGYAPAQSKATLPLRDSIAKDGDQVTTGRRPARLIKSTSDS